jgi:hypothetical protein
LPTLSSTSSLQASQTAANKLPSIKNSVHQHGVFILLALASYRT